jgi:hypothetical protein
MLSLRLVLGSVEKPGLKLEKAKTAVSVLVVDRALKIPTGLLDRGVKRLRNRRAA